jgi:hypothetical protein
LTDESEEEKVEIFPGAPVGCEGHAMSLSARTARWLFACYRQRPFHRFEFGRRTQRHSRIRPPLKIDWVENRAYMEVGKSDLSGCLWRNVLVAGHPSGTVDCASQVLDERGCD